MQREEKDSVLNTLVERNIPFVLFREPSKEAKGLIQTSPLSVQETLNIDAKGFYAFPFSKQEKATPLYFSPDITFLWNERNKVDFDVRTLEAAEVEVQNLYDVSKEEYVSDLENYLEAFDSGTLKKAIYSRVSVEELDEDLSVEVFFENLMSKYPKAFVYVMNIPGNGVWIGASPELLLSYGDNTAKTVALAGTLKIIKDQPAPQWTRKEIDEHRLVEKHIMHLCADLSLPYEKTPVRSSNTGKVYHLKSDFKIQIKTTEIIDFLSRLHPTPAISGLPQKESLALIYDVEKHERSYYCGFLGWVEDLNDFKLFINLRCLKLEGKKYSLFAGGGITPDSEIEKEWDETQVKMATLADLLPKSYSFSD